MLIALLGVVGGTVGAFYSWATSVYSYNREAWMTDIQILQNHDYQYDNLQIGAHTMSRDQIRDRTDAAITKLNNYILVTTLIIALASEMLVEGNIDKDCADFVLNVYMLALGSAILYLALGALFGVAASNVIYETSANLLTIKVPPPWNTLDTKMRDREEQKMTQAFERRPWKQIFMPPMFRRPFARQWFQWDAPGTSRVGREESCLSGCMRGARGVVPVAAQRADPSPGSSQEKTNGGDCESCSGSERLGSERLGSERNGTLGSMVSRFSDASSSRSARSEVNPFLDRPVQGLPSVLAKPRKLTNLGAWGVAEEEEARRSISMDGSPHALYGRNRGVGSPEATLTRTHSPEVQDELKQIQFRYEHGWKEKEQLWMPLFDYSRKCVALGLHSLLQAYGYLCMANLYGDYSSAWAFWLVQSIFLSLNLLITFSIFEIGGRWWALMIVAAGPISCAVAATTPFVWVDRILVPVCYISHLAVSLLLYGIDHGWETGETQGLLCELARDIPDVSESGGEEVASDHHHHKHLFPSSMDRQERHADQTNALVRRMVWWGGCVVKLLWAISVCWSVSKAMSGNGFKNYRAVIHAGPSGPPVASITVNWTAWPSPYFRPHALVCPRDLVYLADEFRVWELDRKKGEVTPYPCDVNGTIADIASDCDRVRCWPVVLLKGIPPTVYDCATRVQKVLLQSPTAAERFSTRGEELLYVARGKRVLQYGWSVSRGGWAPQWDVVRLGTGGLDAMDVIKNRLLLFRTEDERTPGRASSVELINLDSGEPCGIWELPPGLVGAGCAEENGAAVMVLSRAFFHGRQGSGMQLVRAKLEANGHPGCPEFDSEAAAAASAAEAAQRAATVESADTAGVSGKLEDNVKQEESYWAPTGFRWHRHGRQGQAPTTSQPPLRQAVASASGSDRVAGGSGRSGGGPLL